MRKAIRIFWLVLALAAMLTGVGCHRSGDGREAGASPEATAYGEPAAPAPTQTPTPTDAPTPEPTPLLTEYAFEGETAWEQVEQVLEAHPTLRRLDLRGSTLDVREHGAALAALELEELRFQGTLCGVEITDETETFAPLTVPEEKDLEALKLLKDLRCIDLTAAECEPEQIQMVRASFPDTELLWTLDLCGLTVGPDTETLNYNDRPIASLEPFYRTLPLLTKLTALEMCGCGVGNEDMDALRTAFPQAGIVWSIATRHWTVRTDADHFATWRVVRTDAEGKILEAYGINFNTNEDLDWLQYCHDMVALDVGHNSLTDCEFVRNMPDLEYLIIADNRISDLSPIATLSKLKYLEIFGNPVSDLTPLSGLAKLLDLNMCGCNISDLSPLYGLSLLERLWMTPYRLPDQQAAAEAFRSALPNCVLQFVNDGDFTGYGWRRHPRYTEYRLALGRAKP